MGRGFDLPTLVQKKLPKGKLAAYTGETNEIWISSQKPKGGWLKHLKEREVSGHSSHANSVLHEFGHYIHSILAPRDYDTSGYNRPEFNRPPDKDIIMAKLSKYATVSTKEYEAELMAGILSGKVYPPEIIKGSYLRNVSLAEGGDDPKAQALKRMATGELPNTSATEQKFANTMEVLFRQEGAQFQIDILANNKVQDFISSHAQVLNNAFKFEPMSDAMRQRLQRSNYIFSGFKTFHELNEATHALIDENGNRKPFEQFLKDVQKIDQTYNRNYLRAEYNFVHASATMAAKWEEFQQDGDRYNLQYRTAHDDKVRPEHAALDRVTLPITDPFWEEYYPPNGWNCRCTVVQVRKSKYPVTPHDEAMALGEAATGKDTKGIFHFNPGIQQKTVPDYNPYTIRRCRDCDIAKGSGPVGGGSANAKLVALIPENELCAACRFIRNCYNSQGTKNNFSYPDNPEAFDQRRNETRRIMGEGGRIRIDGTNLYTKHLYLAKNERRALVKHAFVTEELDALEKIREWLPTIHDGKYLPIDMSRSNWKKKMEVYGFRNFVEYEINVGGIDFIFKTAAVAKESHSRGRIIVEFPYSLKRKKSE